MTGRPLRVLQLMPQAADDRQLAAYSFLNEELQALADAGVEQHFVSVSGAAGVRPGGLHVHCLGPATQTARAGALAFGLRRAGLVPPVAWRRPVRLANLLRTEAFIATVVRRAQIDVVHSHFAWPHGFGGILGASSAGVPLLASLRGTDIIHDPSIGYGKRRDPVFDGALRKLLGGATRTVYFSQHMRDRGVALGAVPARARVIRKGVDVSHFRPTGDRRGLRTRLGFDDRPMVLSVGGLIARKGIDLTLDALATIVPRRPLQFVVCGEGPDRAALLARAEALGLGGAVRFVGWTPRDTIPDYFAACDVFVLSSRREAAGNVLFEAMASGRPVVCTDAGGPGEYVVDGETGFVTPVDDVRALAARIDELLANPAKADSMGRAGEVRATTEFTYARMVADIVSLYAEVASPESASRT